MELLFHFPLLPCHLLSFSPDTKGPRSERSSKSGMDACSPHSFLQDPAPTCSLSSPGRQAYVRCLASSSGSLLKQILDHGASERKQGHEEAHESRGLTGDCRMRLPSSLSPAPLDVRALSSKPLLLCMILVAGEAGAAEGGGTHMVVQLGNCTEAPAEGLSGASWDVAGGRSTFFFLTRDCPWPSQACRATFAWRATLF